LATDGEDIPYNIELSVKNIFYVNVSLKSLYTYYLIIINTY